MLFGNVKQFELELKKIIRGNIPSDMEKEYDLITNNPYSFLKFTFEGELKNIS